MRKLAGILVMIIALGCSTDSAPDCIQTTGKIIQQEVEVAPFNEIMAYERIKLFIQQGEEQKVVIETGENLINEIEVKVQDSRLLLKNENSCNLFRDYAVTRIYVTTPDLTWLQSSTEWTIESIGTLRFSDLWLRSLNQERDLSIHTDGDFKLDLDVENLRITSDHISNFFLTGKVDYFDGFFAAGDGRLEARDLIVQHYDLFHRGTNKLIINPQQSLKADIYSYGDIISVNRPPVVNVTEHFKGKLIFE